MLQKWSGSPLNPSLHPSVLQFLFASRKDTAAFQADNNLIRPNQCGASHPVFSIYQPFMFLPCLPQPLCAVRVRKTQNRTQIQACVRSTHANRYTHIHRANRAPVPRSLMFVKVINFLCEIRGHGNRTEGECVPAPESPSAFIYWHIGSASPQL